MPHKRLLWVRSSGDLSNKFGQGPYWFEKITPKNLLQKPLFLSEKTLHV